MSTFSKKLLSALAGLVLFSAVLSGCGAQRDMTVIFPNLGSADASLILTDNATVLIDTGLSGDGDVILSLLEENGRDTIDLLLISHYDKDHIGGAAEILETVPVKRVIGSTSPKNSAAMEAYLAALDAAGLSEEIPGETLSITLDHMTVTIDPPGSDHYDRDQSNNSSLVVSVSYGNTALLFAGDAMADRLQELSLEPQAYDLIKIPHHGRDPDNTEFYLDALKDGALAVITSSKKEPEDGELLGILSDSGVSAYLTRKGTVTVVSDGSSLSVTQD